MVLDYRTVSTVHAILYYNVSIPLWDLIYYLVFPGLPYDLNIEFEYLEVLGLVYLFNCSVLKNKHTWNKDDKVLQKQ